MKGERGVKNLLMVSHSLDVKNLSDWWVNKRGGNSLLYRTIDKARGGLA